MRAILGASLLGLMLGVVVVCAAEAAADIDKLIEQLGDDDLAKTSRGEQAPGGNRDAGPEKTPRRGAETQRSRCETPRRPDRAGHRE